ncbi:hypothetical protein [Burkholderia sp. JKS000303]|uniref:hypothetical protein n=1 Tax=Burkholderia sp. JKS000303 TaxID=1938747 RepID=UPI0015CF4F27|nr:hypothetical protein [Burkholderia sp. JKS000303]
MRESLEEALVSVISRSDRPPGPAAECFLDCLIETIRTALSSASPHARNVLQSVDLLI